MAAIDGQLEDEIQPLALPRLSLRQRQGLIGLALISPWLVGLILLRIGPILASLIISFTDFYALEPGQTTFIGLQNYVRVFTDINAGFALFGTLGLALMVIPAQLLVSITFASLLSSKRIVGKELLRIIFFVPTIIPAIATFVVALGFLDPTTGWLNTLILEPLGLPPTPGIFSEAGFNFFVVLVSIWSIGPNFLIMLGAMQGIPTELYEAARVDGAGPLVRFFRITIPMISPAILFSLVINLVSIFGGAALLDQGTAFNFGISAYDNYVGFIMFSEFDYGYGASLAWVFLIMMFVVVMLLFRSTRYWVHYADADGEHAI